MTARVLRKSAAPVVFDAKTARLEALEAEVVELRARVEAAEARAATLEAELLASCGGGVRGGW